VSPHTDCELVSAALELGILPIPGFQTPTEAFSLIDAGARWLKLFPAAGRQSDLSALKAVLPTDVKLVAVGGVDLVESHQWIQAGAAAVGVGGELFRAGMTTDEIAVRARRLIAGLKKPTVIATTRARIGESPIWCAGDERIRWVDPLSRQLHTCEAEGNGLNTQDLSEAVWSIGMRHDGLVGTTDNGFCRVEPSGIKRGPAAEQNAGCRFNDMAVDAGGGLWAGSMHRGLLSGRGVLFWARNPEDVPQRVADNLGVPNGMAFSDDQRTLYVIDTLMRTLLAYPVEGPGTLGEPVIVSDFLGQPGKPDGMCVAHNDTIYVAMWGGACVLHLARDGAVLSRRSIPTPHVSSCVELPNRSIAVSTSTFRLSPQQLSLDANAGALFVLASEPT
jgi:sugar lactone lactonase YvrE